MPFLELISVSAVIKILLMCFIYHRKSSRIGVLFIFGDITHMFSLKERNEALFSYFQITAQ